MSGSAWNAYSYAGGVQMFTEMQKTVDTKRQEVASLRLIVESSQAKSSELRPVDFDGKEHLLRLKIRSLEAKIWAQRETATERKNRMKKEWLRVRHTFGINEYLDQLVVGVESAALEARRIQQFGMALLASSQNNMAKFEMNYKSFFRYIERSCELPTSNVQLNSDVNDGQLETSDFSPQSSEASPLKGKKVKRSRAGDGQSNLVQKRTKY